MRLSRFIVISIVFFMAWSLLAVQVLADEKESINWPILGADLQHTCYRDFELNLPLRVAWFEKIDSLTAERIFGREDNATPVIFDGILYIGNVGGYMAAFGINSGNVMWRNKMPHPMEASPACDGDSVYIGTVGGELYRLNRLTGEEIWKYQADAEIYSAPVPLEDNVFIFTAADDLLSLDRESGTVNWKYSRKVIKQMNIFGHSTPAYSEGVLYAGFTDGNVAAVSAVDGSLIWTTFLSRSSYRFTDIDSSPTISGNTLYIAAFDGNFYALDKRNGEIKFKFEAGGVSTPAVKDDKVYFSSQDGHLYVLNKQTGKLLWKAKIPKGRPTSPSICQNALVVGSTEDGIYIMSPDDGEFIDKYQPGKGVAGTAILTDAGVYFVSSGGYLYRAAPKWKAKPGDPPHRTHADRVQKQRREAEEIDERYLPLILMPYNQNSEDIAVD